MEVMIQIPVNPLKEPLEDTNTAFRKSGVKNLNKY